MNKVGRFEIAKITKARKQEILRLINRALEAQFEIYSWADMMKDISYLSPDERVWATENTGYKAYICE